MSTVCLSFTSVWAASLFARVLYETACTPTLPDGAALLLQLHVNGMEKKKIEPFGEASTEPRRHPGLSPRGAEGIEQQQRQLLVHCRATLRRYPHGRLHTPHMQAASQTAGQGERYQGTPQQVCQTPRPTTTQHTLQPRTYMAARIRQTGSTEGSAGRG